MAAALIEPHGGMLIDRVVTGAEREAALERAKVLPRLRLTAAELADLELIATGALSPLTGFMERSDYRAVVDDMRLAGGLPWTIPITLAVDDDQTASVAVGREVALTALVGDEERVVGVLEVRDRFERDREAEALRVYGTTDRAHPGVARLCQAGRTLLGGPVTVFELPARGRNSFDDLRLTPAQTRAFFARRGWRHVVGFQTRNPIHRAHEYLHKIALETADGLLLHPLVGETDADDLPADLRIASYRAVVEHYYPRDRVLLAAFPAAMRYAGPREAVFHAIARKNYGCSHFIVGRDHAGFGHYYGADDAQRIFDAFTPEEIGITPLRFEHAFYCYRCGSVATSRTCPHGPGDHLLLSGTQVRQMLARGERLPEEFTRPEVSRILIAAARRVNGGP